jgi:hypothetical protein
MALHHWRVGSLVLITALGYGLTEATAQTADELLSKMVVATNADLAASRSLRIGGTLDIHGMGEHEGRKIGSTFDCITDGESFFNKSTIDPKRTSERMTFDSANILFTPDALYVTRFGDRLKPFGCDTCIWWTKSARLSHKTHGTMEWYPAKLCIVAFDPRVAYSKSVTEPSLASGELRLRLEKTVDKTKMEFIVGVQPLLGYRVVSVSVNANGRPQQSIKVEWQEKDTFWFVKSIVSEHFEIGERIKLVVNDIDPKATIGESDFSMVALGMLPDSRIVDLRKPEAPNEASAPTKDKPQPTSVKDLILKPIR